MLFAAPGGCHRDQDLKVNLVSQTSDPVCFSTMLSMRVPPSCVTGLEQSVMNKLKRRASDHLVSPELRAKSLQHGAHRF